MKQRCNTISNKVPGTSIYTLKTTDNLMEPLAEGGHLIEKKYGNRVEACTKQLLESTALSI